MAWYLRKSLRLGPLRINLSKSGLGASVGMKGLRVGTGPGGRYLHAGREGLYYRASLNPESRGTRIPGSEDHDVDMPATGAAKPAGQPVSGPDGQFGIRLLRGIFGGLMRAR
jgi:hypothetical protein